MPRKSRRLARGGKKVTTKLETVEEDTPQQHQRDLLRIALEEIKVSVEDKCVALELSTEEKVQKLKTELLHVLSLMSTADKHTTVREALALQQQVLAAADGAGAGAGAAEVDEDGFMAPPPRSLPTPPATVRRPPRAVPVVPGTRKRPRNQAAAGVIPGTLAPLPSAMMATVKSSRVRPPIALGMQTPAGNRSAAVFGTPLQRGITAATPATRRARRGEVVISLNGSPLGPVGSHAIVADDEPSVAIALSGGAVLSTTEASSVGGLDAASKQEALAKLKRIQEHVASLMTAIES